MESEEFLPSRNFTSGGYFSLLRREWDRQEVVKMGSRLTDWMLLDGAGWVLEGSPSRWAMRSTYMLGWIQVSGAGRPAQTVGTTVCSHIWGPQTQEVAYLKGSPQIKQVIQNQDYQSLMPSSRFSFIHSVKLKTALRLLLQSWCLHSRVWGLGWGRSQEGSK